MPLRLQSRFSLPIGKLLAQRRGTYTIETNRQCPLQPTLHTYCRIEDRLSQPEHLILTGAVAGPLTISPVPDGIFPSRISALLTN